VDASAEIGHQISKRAGLPTLVERGEALGYAVGRRRNLVGVDRVQFFVGLAGIPENQRTSAYEVSLGRIDEIAWPRTRQVG
jgi:hypothetical protein